MNKKYIASLIGGLLISMALGSHAETPEKKIIGKWYNPHTYRMSGELKGFQFKKGGKWKALGIKILDLKTWKIKDGNLIIEGDRLPQEPGEERSEYRTVEKIEILRNDSLRVLIAPPSRMGFLYVKKNKLPERQKENVSILNTQIMWFDFSHCLPLGVRRRSKKLGMESPLLIR